MRFVFTPPAETGAVTGLGALPWRQPLADWDVPQLVEIRNRGLHRHVVRFVAESGDVYAVKELDERLARREYTLLRQLDKLGIPAVEAVGVVVDRPDDMDAVLVTKVLEYAIPYRALFAHPRGEHPTGRLLDAQVELLARLHLGGFMWGDCSLSNTLFRLDAGALAAYLVDAETAELHPVLSTGQRTYDVEMACERVAGELFDLAAAGMLPAGTDPVQVADELARRYHGLWHELTREEIVRPDQQRYRIAERLRRLNELGFDVDEVELVEAGPVPGDGYRLKLRTRVAEPGHHRRLLFSRTGLAVQENQARRLLGDIAGYRAHLEHVEGRPVSEAVAASRWLAKVYDPVIAAIPAALRGRLDDAEIYHEILEHRWFLSEATGRDVGTELAQADYFARVLPAVPEDLTQTPSAQ